jgi:SAM-dependent methyltransferase
LYRIGIISIMHDTAFRIGTLVMNIYADLSKASILEIGSQAFNGALRESASQTTNYVGVDIEEGAGVDLVVEPGKPLPVDENSFDLVIASSVFEHDPCFWLTFLEMCRVTKEGGYIYINAPSNGWVHRYPQDNWRFYPDSGKALVQWARSQGQSVTLVESFIADRVNDGWNDFAAVFLKGHITKKLPKVFVHEHVSCSNILTWQSNEVINPINETQDILLLAEANDQARLARDSLAELEARQASLEAEKTQALVRLEATQAKLLEAEGLRAQLSQRESEVRQRQEEIEQTRSELTRAEQARDEANGRFELETVARREAEATLIQWKGAYEREQVRCSEITSELQQLSGRHEQLTLEKEAVEGRLEALRSEIRDIEERSAAREREMENALVAARKVTRDKVQEIASLERLRASEIEKTEWLCQVGDALARQPSWWGIMPSPWRARRMHRLLVKLGLFDVAKYLADNPDVASSGLDPLRHYLLHGMNEGRSRPF